MVKLTLDEFIKYVREEFDCDIIVKSNDTQDTFEYIFGTSFSNNECKSVDEFGID